VNGKWNSSIAVIARDRRDQKAKPLRWHEREGSAEKNIFYRESTRMSADQEKLCRESRRMIEDSRRGRKGIQKKEALVAPP
jgi:putative heme degradation protein